MKRLTFLIALLSLNFCSAVLAGDITTQTFSVDAANLNLVLPSDWIKMPERALARFSQGASQIAPKINNNYVAGFAGPRPPANTPITLIFVQVFPSDLTPTNFLASLRASQQALAKARPDLKLVQPDPYVDNEIGAVVVPGRTHHGTSGRSYTIPTSQGILSLDLYCPTENSDTTFKTIETCLKKISFTNGAELNKKWLAEFAAAQKEQ
jgi:hypothetical protein